MCRLEIWNPGEAVFAFVQDEEYFLVRIIVAPGRTADRSPVDSCRKRFRWKECCGYEAGAPSDAVLGRVHA
jgi:hypothetical protein